ncbi:probable pseudouridine-5'-phosphatase [Onthophagus taurus]|uniref:probable pseudouridine-5'-phosphatase n=1 Tax=Onthophagus taurus TaxID=166361 RepID=UPI000C207FF7|nr:probable pseudouridine-5'-phosphatase [Onthophagus taurus]
MRNNIINYTKNFYNKSFRRATHVIFDMDGLILDTECIYTKVISDIAQKFGKQYTKNVRIKLLGTVEADSSKIAVQEMQLPITWEEFREEFSLKSSIQLRKCPLMPGAEKLIRHLKANKVPIAIATSSTQESMEYKTEHLKSFFDLFDHKVCGGSDPEVRQGKPAPDIFLVCAKRFPDKPHPEKCLVLEDAPNGARGAIDAGMQCVIVPDQDVPHDLCNHATQIIPSLKYIRPEHFGLPPFTS